MKDDPRPDVVQEVKFLTLEGEARGADRLDVKKIPELLARLKAFFAKETLVERHLRLASSTVRAINRLEDVDQRNKHFQEFGELFAKSKNRRLARDGKSLAKKPAAPRRRLRGARRSGAQAVAKRSAGVTRSLAGWPRAVARPGLPQIRT